MGYKSAVRMAFSVLDMSEEEVAGFAASFLNVKKNVRFCTVCQNISEEEVCAVCSSDKRDKTVICVVQNTKDVAALEKIKEYQGQYHVLGGLISPIDGIGPDMLKIKELLKRLNDGVEEVIIATNPSIEGESTAMYLSKLIKPLGIKVTRLAYGIPVGGELEYTDEMTLYKAMEGRLEI